MDERNETALTLMAVSSSVRRDLEHALAVVAVARERGASLTDTLYADWYTRRPTVRDDAVDTAPSAAEINLVGALRAAHHDSAVFRSGWVVRAVSSKGRAVVERDGEQRTVSRPDFVATARALLPPREGDEVSVTARRDQLDPETGFWFATSEPAPTAPIERPEVRHYLNVRPHRAPHVVRVVTDALADLPYTMKTVAFPGGYQRADSMVVYSSFVDHEEIGRRLLHVHPLIDRSLRPWSPCLTDPLAPGLSTADDPGGGKSFGEYHCAVIAAAVTSVSAAHPPALSSAIGAIVERWIAAGIDPDRPFRLRDLTGEER